MRLYRAHMTFQESLATENYLRLREPLIATMIQETMSNYIHLGKKIHKKYERVNGSLYFCKNRLKMHTGQKQNFLFSQNDFVDLDASKDVKFCGLKKQLGNYKINIQFNLSSLSSSTN